MKKCFVLLIFILFLTSCGSGDISTEISIDKFNEELPINEFVVNDYLEKIESLLLSRTYLRIDSIFLDEKDKIDYITKGVTNNILNIFDVYSYNHSTYELINFLDMHVKEISRLDLDILLYRVVQKVESEYYVYRGILDDERFLYITKGYTNRITNTFLENYIITEEILEKYPDINKFLDDLYYIINGGYQIRIFNDVYYIFPDYASILVRYDDYYSEEAKMITNILVRESRNLVKVGDIIQIDNEAIAYKINQLEIFLKLYKNSMYFEIARNMYFEYLTIMISNPSNVSEITTGSFIYEPNIMYDFIIIAERYSDYEMARILNEFIKSIHDNDDKYNEFIIEDIINNIIMSY